MQRNKNLTLGSVLNTIINFHIRGAGGTRSVRESAVMKQLVRSCLILAMAVAVHPEAAVSKPMDGFRLESASTLNRGAWNLKSSLEFGSGAKPLIITTAGGIITVKVNTIRLPVEIRYGLTENIEVGGDLGIESDAGTKATVSGVTTSYLDGSGIQRIRLLGKWNFWHDLSAMTDLSFLGKNELYYSLDSFDFGLKFMYGPQIGPGTFNINLGFLLKGGDADIDGDGKAVAQEAYAAVFSYGFGYVNPFSDRLTGTLEIVGSSSPYEGGTGVAAKSLLGLMSSLRYGISDQFFLDGGLGLGLGKGSPAFLLNLGVDWLWGAAPESMTSTAPSERWTPGAAANKPAVPAAATTTAAGTAMPPKPDQPYYEPPTRYDTPKPASQAAPTGPTLEQQLASRVADATAAFNRGDYVTAAAQYEAAIKLNDHDPMVYYNLATAYFQIKKYTDAKTHYKNAITYNPADPDSHLYLGYTYYYLQDQASAIREWQKVLEIDPANSLARENLKSLGVE